MKYEKPEVQLIGSAIDVVQNPADKNSIESEDAVTRCSELAYPADE
jgi:hypothetical protein